MWTRTVALLALLLASGLACEEDSPSALDTSPPSVVISTPLSGELCSGILEITALAVDDGEVDRVAFVVDDVELGVDDSAPYVQAWNTNFHQDLAAHRIEARATDAAGNVGLPAFALVTLDGEAMERPLLSLPDDGYVAAPVEEVEFVWGSMVGASAYELQVAADAGFLEIVQGVELPDTFVTAALLPEGRYHWRVRGLDERGWPSAWSASRYYNQGILGIICGVVDDAGEPIAGATVNVIYDAPFPCGGFAAADAGGGPRDAVVLEPNYPNPSDHYCILRLIVNESAQLSMTILDRQGAEVRELYEGIFQPGSHALVWDGLNTAGDKVPNGSYTFRCEEGDLTHTLSGICLNSVDTASLLSMETFTSDADGEAVIPYAGIAVGDSIHLTCDSSTVQGYHEIGSVVEVVVALDESTWQREFVDLGDLSAGVRIEFVLSP